MSRPAGERDVLVMTGVVIETHRGDFYTVDAQFGASKRRVLCKRTGRLNIHRIRVDVGDSVELEVSPYDLTRGRITRRGPPRGK